MKERIRRQAGLSPRACGVCGETPLLVMESWTRRRGLAAFLLPRRLDRRSYALCRRCGCRSELDEVTPA